MLFVSFRNVTSFKQIVPGQVDTLKSVNIPENSRLNFIIHGFMQDINSSIFEEMKDSKLM